MGGVNDARDQRYIETTWILTLLTEQEMLRGRRGMFEKPESASGHSLACNAPRRHECSHQRTYHNAGSHIAQDLSTSRE